MEPETLEAEVRLRSLLDLDDPEAAAEALARDRVEDLADGISRLEAEEAAEILKLLDARRAAEVVLELPTSDAKELVQLLDDQTLATYLDILPMDDAIELHEELEPERFDSLLQRIPKRDAQEIRRLLSYPEGTVGREMTEAFFRVDPDATMESILADVRRASEDKYETVNDMYVLDEHDELLGLFSLRRAIRADPETTARSIMRTEVISVRVTDDVESAARTMARYGLSAMPVLDGADRMVGILTGDDATETLEEEHGEDIHALGAVSGGVEAYLSLSPLRLAWKRLPWLGALFVAETFTGLVMRHYGDQGTDSLPLSPLTFFIPLLIGAGGNAGSQATTMVTRALAVGEVKPRDWWTVFSRELVTALIVGLSLGVVGWGRALLWGTDMQLSVVVGVALPLIVVWATVVGAMLPLAAKRLGIDPAVMSAPFISTFVDATGLVIYFETARHILGGL